MKAYRLKQLSKKQLHEAPVVIRLISIRKHIPFETFRRFPEYFEPVPEEKIVVKRQVKPNLFKRNVSPKLKKYRIENNLSIQQMADLFKVAYVTYWDWEKGGAVPTKSNKILISNFLNKNINDVITH